jgi:hypothetical protein
MAHAQKPDFVFRRKGRVHLNRRGASVQSTTGSRGVSISVSNAGYTMFRGSVKGTDYPLHSPISPSLPFPYLTVYHHVSNRLYHVQVPRALAGKKRSGGRAYWIMERHTQTSHYNDLRLCQKNRRWLCTWILKQNC